MKTKTIQVADILEEFRRGVSDEEIMEKFQVSRKGFEELYRQVLHAIAAGSTQIRMEFSED